MSGQSKEFWDYLEARLLRHHEPLHELLETLIRKVDHMSETVDSALATISGKVDALEAAITQFGSDVAADIASLNTGGVLNDTQKAAADALAAKVDALIANVGSLDATVKPAASSAA